MVSELAKGRRWKKRWKLHRNQWPKSYMVCRRTNFTAGNLGAQALHLQLRDYKKKQQPAGQTAAHCPYCDVEGTSEDDPLCQACKTRWSTVRTAARLSKG